MNTTNATRPMIDRPRVRVEREVPDEPPVTRKLGEVENEVMRIQSILQNAHEKVSKLIAQLDPILSAPLPVDQAGQASAMQSCQMGETLRQIGNGAQELVDRLNDVGERIRL